ncbi:hypothetical protein B5S27_g3462 [[Candida] boidinii]|nr:hypothetical protein B5S27_g3462 [[Candida] boidinii]
MKTTVSPSAAESAGSAESAETSEASEIIETVWSQLFTFKLDFHLSYGSSQFLVLFKITDHRFPEIFLPLLITQSVK